MKQMMIASFALILMVGCKSKKDKKQEVPAADFFVNDYVKGQVAKLDTALYSFYKIETVDGRSDTTPIKNTDVRQYARDFLDLPDIAGSNIKNDYEVSHLYDELQNAFIFTYMTKEEHPVRQQDITVEPEMNAEGKNDIRSVYVVVWNNKGDSLIRKNLFWESNKSFQVTSTIEVSGEPEKVKRLKVFWNGFERQTN
ncbi:MAG TPA: hypothetical protein VF609_14965 [Flavisolibacter sp.]|jgi:hypothetical protein